MPRYRVVAGDPHSGGCYIIGGGCYIIEPIAPAAKPAKPAARTTIPARRDPLEGVGRTRDQALHQNIEARVRSRVLTQSDQDLHASIEAREFDIVYGDVINSALKEAAKIQQRTRALAPAMATVAATREQMLPRLRTAVEQHFAGRQRLRDQLGHQRRMICGYACRWDVSSERCYSGGAGRAVMFRRGCFDHALASGAPVQALVAHNARLLIGSTAPGWRTQHGRPAPANVDIWADGTGLLVAVELDSDDFSQGLLAAVHAGIVGNMSIGWDWERATHHETVSEIHQAGLRELTFTSEGAAASTVTLADAPYCQWAGLDRQLAEFKNRLRQAG